MHPVSAFHETDRARLETFVSGRGFALVIGAGPGGPVAAHAPVLVANGLLWFHLSAANRLCRLLEARPHALAVVTGPDAYVSPDWYAAADQVPTWTIWPRRWRGL